MIEILVVLILLESLLPLYYLYMKLLTGRSDCNILKKYDYKSQVSLVIPTYNEEATIGKKLQNLLEQDYTGKLEIIIVDGCSEDGTISIINNFMRQHPELNIELIREKKRGGKIQALNLTFPKCNGELICISDSDCIWDKNALKEVIANFSDENIGGVTGSRNLISKKGTAEKMEEHYNSFNETLRAGESVLDSTPIFRGELAIYRKKLLDKIKVGTESAWADDSEIAVKIRKFGYRAIIDKKAKYYEFAAPSIKSRQSQKLRRGAGLIRLFLNNWYIILNPQKYGKYSLIIGMNLFMVLISPILLLLIILFGAYFIFSTLSIVHLVVLIALVAMLSIVQYYIFSNKVLTFVLSFLQSQFTLLASIPFLFSKRKEWEQIKEVRDKWNNMEEIK